MKKNKTEKIINGKGKESGSLQHSCSEVKFSGRRHLFLFKKKLVVSIDVDMNVFSPTFMRRNFLLGQRNFLLGERNFPNPDRIAR